MEEALGRFDRSGVLFRNGFFIFCHVTETKQKNTPVSRFILRVVVAAGAETHPAFSRAQTVRALFSVRIADARRGTKRQGEKRKHRDRFYAPFEGAA
jgi:hypothetical protein